MSTIQTHTTNTENILAEIAERIKSNEYAHNYAKAVTLFFAVVVSESQGAQVLFSTDCALTKQRGNGVLVSSKQRARRMFEHVKQHIAPSLAVYLRESEKHGIKQATIFIAEKPETEQFERVPIARPLATFGTLNYTQARAK